jgi:nucleoside-diphosphate-sugar epimerase
MDVDRMRYLITGGSGFIGSHVVDRLLDRGDDVVVVDNYRTGRRVNLEHREGDPRLTLIEYDVVEPLDDARFRGRFERVLHLASPASPVGYARYSIETLLTNSIGTRNALDFARRNGARFLVSSTSEVYGDPLVHPQRENYWGNVNPIGPRACYDESKRFGESLTMEYHRVYGIDVRIARIFNTYGPRSDPDDGRVVPNFCVQALQGAPITIYGTGLQTRSFCYVDDLVSGLLALIEVDGLAGEVVNLGNPSEITVREFAETVVRLAGSTSGIVYQPLPMDDPTRRQPDISKARQMLGWEPRVSLEAGLAKTLAYFAETFAHVESVSA